MEEQKWQEAEATIKDFNTVLTRQEKFYFRALQGHSGRNPIDPSLQDNVLIPNNFFEYIYHIGCAVNLHSITNSGLITGGQNSSRDRQTVFFTAVNPMHKNHQDPKELDLNQPRLASYKKKKWKVHQDTVYWVDIQLAQRKGLKFYQTRSNAVILYDTLPAYCISKAIVMKSEEVKNQRVYVSLRLPPKISYDFQQDVGSFLGPGSEKKWYSTYIDRPRGEWDRVAELMMNKFSESGHQVFRATSPLSRGTLKSKGGGKISIHFCADDDTIETVFRTIISVNQLGFYGAVSDLCNEYRVCQARTGRLVLTGQPDTLFEPASMLMKTPTPSTDPLQKYLERVERLSQQDRVIKICTDAGFLTTVEVRTVLHGKGH